MLKILRIKWVRACKLYNCEIQWDYNRWKSKWYWKFHTTNNNKNHRTPSRYVTSLTATWKICVHTFVLEIRIYMKSKTINACKCNNAFNIQRNTFALKCRNHWHRRHTTSFTILVSTINIQTLDYKCDAFLENLWLFLLCHHPEFTCFLCHQNVSNCLRSYAEA